MNHNQRKIQGSALVIVLAMVVLLTALIVAFFSQSLLEQRISQSSSSQTKVDLFAQGAMSSIVAEFRQEMADNSTPVTIPTGLVSTTVYTYSATAAVPSRESVAGIVNNPTDLPNLVAMSSAANALYVGGNNRASSALSSGTSLNGRSISISRWNKPLLLPKDDASSINLTPQTTFFPKDGSKSPNWILVTRDGSNPQAWNNNLRIGGGAGEVVGRYAYMVYNEGGLLDANVAGGPAVPSGMLTTVWNRKGSAAFADLTRIGLDQTEIDQLVGWRNYANIQPENGSLPNLKLGSNAPNNYLDYAIGQNQRFMSVSGTLYKEQSDHAFTSRQQLIQFLTEGLSDSKADKARRQNTLQYLGIFNRSLNQPSYRPVYDATGKPSVSSATGLTVSSTTINVAFQDIRVSGTFTRNDGSIAEIGEPLVKKRFPLSYLLWLTYQGPSSEAMNDGDILFTEYVNRGLPGAEVNRLRVMGTGGANGNIHKYFGLTWNSANGGSWTYDSTLLVGGKIARLSEISRREPNFFELLRAGIHVGAIANTINTDLKDDELRNLDSQIIQIGANIINQARPDNYPCRIVFNGRAYWGTVDLPYLYGLTTVAVLVDKGTSSPALTSNLPLANATISKPGQVALLDVPIIWNSHQNNTNAAGYANSPLTPGLSPRKLRINISSNNMAGTAVGTTNMQASFNVDNDYRAGTTGHPNVALGNWFQVKYTNGKRDTTLGYVDMSNSTTALEFTNPADQSLYREPTPLLRPSHPANSELKQGGNNTIGKVTEYGTTNEYLGFFLTNMNSLYPITVSGTNYVYTTNYVFAQSSNLFTVSLEYQDGNNNWIPYRQVAFAKEGNQMCSGVPYDYNSSEDLKGPGGNPYLQSLLVDWRGNNSALGYVRATTINWNGTNYTPCYTRDMHVTIDPRINWGCDFSGITTGQWLDTNNPEEIKTYWPTLTGNYADAEMFHGYYYGNCSTDMRKSQPNPIGYNSRLGEAGTDSKGYYMDADGIVRRPMGGYVANNITGMPLITVKGVSGQTSNRPIMLQRPFRSVAELGYVFANVPWRQLNMITPESGFNPLLDIFSVNDDTQADALEAGRVDLNTLQPPVLQAILSGAYRDEFALYSNTQDPLNVIGSVDEPAKIASALIIRTTSTQAGKGPLTNIADLVGRYTQNGGLNLGYAQTLPYNGFSAELQGLYGGAGTTGDKNKKIMRFMESTVRALSDSGQAGTWNLMIDVITQTGQYPANARTLDDFMVDGEKRYWLHIAIDRQTGKIIDRQLEEVTE
ncbi:MAG: hypothetical protein LBH01_06790 [Verrucomicrobiales bacterium]|jgi:hypothetical protein|nr:hypothetical protein [Verrucomicrobiales bacterium]